MTQKNNQTLRSINLPETIADKIRELITQGDLAPGVQLRQMELSEQFGTSRVPLREALKRLTVEGVVVHDQNRGFFVAKFSHGDAKQLYRIRFLLEREILTTIEWPSAAQLKQLDEKIHELEDMLQGRNSLGWLQKYREFFSDIFSLSDQNVLVQEALRFMRLTDSYRSLAPFIIDHRDRKPAYEMHLLVALRKQSREELLKAYEEDRARIEEGLLQSLRMRGL